MRSRAHRAAQTPVSWGVRWQNRRMPRPIEALIHADALAHNLRRARAAAPDAKVWAVIKANGYGHGIERVVPALRDADGFALLDLDEAQRVRALGWRGPVLLLEGCFEARDLELCSRLGLWHTVHHEAQIDMLAAHKTKLPHQVFLKLNCGMNRLGFDPGSFRAAWQRLSGLTQVESITLMTHFSDADGPTGVSRQLGEFEDAARDLPGARSLCNSAATLRFAGELPAVRGDWVRPGIMLYGSSPDHPLRGHAHWDLQPAMTLRARLIATRELRAGDSVGYGSSFTAAAPMRIGIAACGYADGYPRSAPTGTPALVDGVRTRVVGRVSMDMITLDLTPVTTAGVGSEVTLWGRGPGSSVLGIDDVASAAGTLGYELMCALAPRVPVRLA
jgi:alanine racemase